MSRTSLSHAQFEWREQVWVRGCPHQKDRLSFEYMKQNNSKYWFLLWWWSHRAITFATKDFLSAGQIDSLNVSLKQNKSSLNFPLHWGSDKVLAHSSAWLTAWKKGCSVQGQQPLAPGGAGLCLSSSWELIRWQSIVIPGYPSDHPRIAQPGLSTSASRCITISCPLNKASDGDHQSCQKIPGATLQGSGIPGDTAALGELWIVFLRWIIVPHPALFKAAGSEINVVQGASQASQLFKANYSLCAGP